MALDIGTIIFAELLGMNYPGSVFSGQIINDLVMFLFIPTVFIIVVVYTLVGRLSDNPRIKMLLGIAFFLFIVFGGYYPMFALLAGPYFLFLLILMGILVFFFSHFKRRGGGGGTVSMPVHAMPASAAAAPETTAGEMIFQYEQLSRNLKDAEDTLRRLEIDSRTNIALDRSVAVQREAVMNLKKEVNRLELEIRKMHYGHGVESRLKELQRRYRIKK